MARFTCLVFTIVFNMFSRAVFKHFTSRPPQDLLVVVSLKVQYASSFSNTAKWRGRLLDLWVKLTCICWASVEGRCYWQDCGGLCVAKYSVVGMFGRSYDAGNSQGIGWFHMLVWWIRIWRLDKRRIHSVMHSLNLIPASCTRDGIMGGVRSGFPLLSSARWSLGHKGME